MATRTTGDSVAAYIAAHPGPSRRVLQRVRATIRKALPEADEVISYQIPCYKLHGRMVLYFAGFQQHYSIYPATALVIRELADDLAERVHSKATIRFSYEDPVPTRLIRRIARLRAAEVGERTVARASKPSGLKKARRLSSKIL